MKTSRPEKYSLVPKYERINSTVGKQNVINLKLFYRTRNKESFEKKTDFSFSIFFFYQSLFEFLYWQRAVM
jgi:hypothetical protein